MTMRVLTTLLAPSLALSMLVSGCASSAGDAELSPGGGSGGLLPANPTAAERLGKADGWDPRDENPAMYGFTGAPGEPVRLPGEFEPADGLLIGYASSGAQLQDFFVEIIAAASSEIPTKIYVQDESQAASLYSDLSFAGADMEGVSFDYTDLDSIWMRDYGPMVVEGESGNEYTVDGRYYWGRWMDDYLPTVFAESTERAVVRPALEFEGGNLLGDGTGKCVTTEALVSRNSGFGYDQADVAAILENYYGCNDTTFVPPMLGEGTGHVDMHVHITGPGQVLVGSYTPSQDAENSARLDETAARLTAAGFEVTRIPMPDNDSRYIFRSYTNALATNGAVLVPVYDEDSVHEAEALDIFAEAFPGRTIVPIDSDDVIQWSGAVHCVTMTY